MSDLVDWQRAPTFQSAAAVARELAMTYAEDTVVRHEGGEWVVFASRTLVARIRQEEFNLDIEEAALCESEDAAEDDEALEIALENEQTRQEIEQEMSSDVCDWARSEECGWYYED
jgi:vacuolar-type H+-ATPase subunit B/Vma2